MKLAVAIASQDALPSAFVVWRGFAESMRKAAAYGFQGVELALKGPADIERDGLRRLLKQHHLEVSAISTGQVFAANGLYFTHPDPKARQAVIEVFDGLIRLAQEFGGLVNIGRVRGFVAPSQSRAEAEALFLDTAQRIGAIAERCGVTLLLEPVNRYEINFINNLDEGTALLARLASQPFGLMPDVFHMNIEDNHLGASLRRNAAAIRYVHLADSNRLAPGQGHLNFDEVFAALGSFGFNGWACAEILPLPDPDSAAAAAANYLRPRIERYNAEVVGQASGLPSSRQPAGLAKAAASQRTGKPEACRDSGKLETCATTPLKPSTARRTA